MGSNATNCEHCLNTDANEKLKSNQGLLFTTKYLMKISNAMSKELLHK